MNCKPGDLAYIVRSIRSPENVGRIVEVVKLVPKGKFHHAEIGAVELSRVCWEIRFVGSPGVCPRLGGSSVVSWITFAHDSYLRPISGVPVHDEEHNEVTA